MEWRIINGFPDYSVSECGNIRNNNTLKVLVDSTAGSGYRKVTLCRYGKHFTKYVHRLVVEAFIPNNLNKPEVNHIDGNKKNNSVNNLEWATRSENSFHAFNVLDSTEARRKMSQKRKGGLSYAARKVIRLEDGKIYECVVDAANDIGVHRTCVGEVCRGTQNSTGGYHYKYLDDVRGLTDAAHKDDSTE